MNITLRLRNILLRRQDIDLEQLLERQDYTAAFADLCNAKAWIEQVMMNPGAFALLLRSERAGTIFVKSAIAMQLLISHPDLKEQAAAGNIPIYKALCPAPPEILTPVQNAQNIKEPLTISIGGYKAPYGVPQKTVRFALVKEGQNNTVFDSGEVVPVNSCQVPGGILEASTNYTVKVLVKDSDGLWSAESTVAIQTAEEVVAIIPPTLTISDDVGEVTERPALTSTEFSVSSGNDTHIATQWQIFEQGQNVPVFDSGEDTENLTVFNLPPAVLLPGRKNYSFRARHKGENKGWSAWGTKLEVVTRQFFDTGETIGIVLLGTNKVGGVWGYVDVDENVIPKPPKSYFDEHPVWGGIEDVMIDGQYMVKIPKFYFRRTTISKGPYKNKDVWWLSDKPNTKLNLKCHPAFKKNFIEKDQFYVGKYNASNGIIEGVHYEAVDSKNCNVSPLSRDIFQRNPKDIWPDCPIYHRNRGGVSGFCYWNIYMVGAIQMLCLIEYASMDSALINGKRKCPQKLSLAGTYPGCMAYRSIEHLWGILGSYVEGIYQNDQRAPEIISSNGGADWHVVNLTNANNGPERLIVNQEGEDYDFTALFFPRMHGGPAKNPLQPNNLYSNPQQLTVGGNYNYEYSGLFNFYTVGFNYNSSSNRHQNTTTRIAKI